MTYVEREVARKLNKQRCPICGGIEDCDHTVSERLRALSDPAYLAEAKAEEHRMFPNNKWADPSQEPSDV